MIDYVTVLLYCAYYPHLTPAATRARGDLLAERALAKDILRLVPPQCISAAALWELVKTRDEADYQQGRPASSALVQEPA